MKLNPDCIRDILSEVEFHADSFQSFRYDSEDCHASALNAYTRNEILYHVQQCKSNNLIESYEEFGGGEIIYISDLTPDGHAFLAFSKNPDFWSQVKEKFSKLGATVLPPFIQMLFNLAESSFRGMFD